MVASALKRTFGDTVVVVVSTCGHEGSVFPVLAEISRMSPDALPPAGEVVGLSTGSCRECEPPEDPVRCDVCFELPPQRRPQAVPCGHSSVCSRCWVRIWETRLFSGKGLRCPMCRTPVQTFV